MSTAAPTPPPLDPAVIEHLQQNPVLAQQILAQAQQEAAAAQPPPEAATPAPTVTAHAAPRRITIQPSEVIPPTSQTATPAPASAAAPPSAPRIGLPIALQFIEQMRNPQSAAAPGQPAPSRMDLFEHFLGNFLYSLSQGLAAGGHGPGANERGAAAALTAPYALAVQRQQLASQLGQQQAATQEAQARTALADQQANLYKTNIPVTLPNGMQVLMPAAVAEKIIPSAFSANARTGAATTALKGALAKIGMTLGPNGAPVAMSPDQLSPQQKASIAVQSAAAGLSAARAALAAAQAAGVPQEIAIKKQLLQKSLDQFQLALQGMGLRQQANDRANATFNAKEAAGILGLSGTTADQVSQAKIVINAGNALINDLAVNSNKLGNVQSILNTAFLNTPASDPTSARLASEIKSFAALNPKMHGFRGQGAMEEFTKIIGGLPKNPAALAQSIQGIVNTASIIYGTAATQGVQNNAPPVTETPRPVARPAAAMAAGFVMMRAPNGQVRPVPASQIAHYQSLGAKVVK